MSSHHRAQQVAFFDVETTTDQDKDIVEFACVVVDKHRWFEVETYSTLIRSDRVSQRSTSINGISSSMLTEAPTFAQVADKIEAILAGRVWAGHNLLAFDVVELTKAFGQLGRPAPQHAGVLDTLQYLKKHFPARTADNKLDTFAQYFGLGTQKHRALSDCRLTIAVLQHAASTLFLESTGYTSGAGSSSSALETKNDAGRSSRATAASGGTETSAGYQQLHSKVAAIAAADAAGEDRRASATAAVGGAGASDATASPATIARRLATGTATPPAHKEIFQSPLFSPKGGSGHSRNRSTARSVGGSPFKYPDAQQLAQTVATIAQHDTVAHQAAALAAAHVGLHHVPAPVESHAPVPAASPSDSDAGAAADDAEAALPPLQLPSQAAKAQPQAEQQIQVVIEPVGQSKQQPPQPKAGNKGKNNAAAAAPAAAPKAAGAGSWASLLNPHAAPFDGDKSNAAAPTSAGKGKNRKEGGKSPRGAAAKAASGGNNAAAAASNAKPAAAGNAKPKSGADLLKPSKWQGQWGDDDTEEPASPSPAASSPAAPESASPSAANAEDGWTTVETRGKPKDAKAGAGKGARAGSAAAARKGASGTGAAGASGQREKKKERPGEKVAPEKVSALVQAAIAKKGSLFISYAVGRAGVRQIQPKRWDNKNVFVAFVADTNEETHFAITKVLGLGETKEAAKPKPVAAAPAGAATTSAAAAAAAAPTVAATNGTSAAPAAAAARPATAAASTVTAAAPAAAPKSAWGKPGAAAPKVAAGKA